MRTTNNAPRGRMHSPLHKRLTLILAGVRNRWTNAFMAKRNETKRPIVPLIGLCIWMFTSAATLDLPITVQRNHVIVRAQADLAEQARAIADQVPADLQRIASDLPELPSPKRIEIRLVKYARDLPLVAPSGYGAPTWAAGVAYTREGVIVVAHGRGSELLPLSSTVTHELAHLALATATGNRETRWLTEGFAYLHSADWSLARMQTLGGMAWGGTTIPLRELDQRFPREHNGVDRAYAQSYDFVAYLAFRGRYPDPDDNGDRWPFRRFLRAIASGTDINRAAVDAFGATLEQLEQEWILNLRERYLWVPGTLVGLTVWCAAALLLVLGFLRRRRKNRAILAQWAAQERIAEEMAESD